MSGRDEIVGVCMVVKQEEKRERGEIENGEKEPSFDSNN